jgi:hypothetical protein
MITMPRNASTPVIVRLKVITENEKSAWGESRRKQFFFMD